MTVGKSTPGKRLLRWFVDNKQNNEGKGKNGNLHPVKNSEEAKTRGAAGGKKSGEKRRLKKSVLETVETMLSRKVTNPQIIDKLCGDFSKDAKSYLDYIVAAQIYKAGKGNTQAFNALVSILPKDRGEDSASQNSYNGEDLMFALMDRKIKGVDDEEDDK